MSSMLYILPVIDIDSECFPRLCCDNCAIQVKASNLQMMKQVAVTLMLHDCKYT